MQLKKCHEELNKRIYEHDKLVAEGSDKTDITLKVGAVHKRQSRNQLYIPYVQHPEWSARELIRSQPLQNASFSLVNCS